MTKKASEFINPEAETFLKNLASLIPDRLSLDIKNYYLAKIQFPNSRPDLRQIAYEKNRCACRGSIFCGRCIHSGQLEFDEFVRFGLQSSHRKPRDPQIGDLASNAFVGFELLGVTANLGEPCL